MPLSGSPQVQAVVICPGGANAYSWSRDGRSLTYITEVPDTTAPRGSRLDWHLVSGGSDRVIGPAPIWVIGIECGPGDIDDVHVAFSPDGRYISLLENFCGAADFQVRRSDGSLVGEIKGTYGLLPLAPTMGVWSGSTLYFRDSKGVEAWRDGTVTPFLPGVAWIRPKVSPLGGEITYVVRGKDGLGRVYIVDTGTGKVVPLPNAGRVEPVFLSPRYIWYAGEQLCTTGYCWAPGTLPTGKTYIYDIPAGTETESRITAVYDVWPHGS
jgi:hypothetical protein